MTFGPHAASAGAGSAGVSPALGPQALGAQASRLHWGRRRLACDAGPIVHRRRPACAPSGPFGGPAHAEGASRVSQPSLLRRCYGFLNRVCQDCLYAILAVICHDVCAPPAAHLVGLAGPVQHTIDGLGKLLVVTAGEAAAA